MVILLVALLLVGHLLKMLLCKLLLRNAQTLSIALLESSRARLRGLRRCSVAGIVGWGPWARHRRGPCTGYTHFCILACWLPFSGARDNYSCRVVHDYTIARLYQHSTLYRNSRVGYGTARPTSSAQETPHHQAATALFVPGGEWCKEGQLTWAVELHACHLSSCGIGLH